VASPVSNHRWKKVRCNLRTLLVGVAISSLLMISSLNAARAADLAVKTPAPPTAPWSWTGFYVGLQGGGGGTDQVTALQLCGTGGICTSLLGPVGFSQSSFGISGMFGGATAGYNWQTGPLDFRPIGLRCAAVACLCCSRAWVMRRGG
jgi:outer membrane immunogenic protein